MAAIFHDLPAGDRPLVRTPLQKVLVSFHRCSLIPREKISSLVQICIAFVAACFLFFQWVMFLLCDLGFLRLCDLGFDVTVVLMKCWLGLVGFGFWLISLLAQVCHHGFT